MKARGSLQRWLTLAALLSVGLSVGVGGVFVQRTVEERWVDEAEGALESVLRLGAGRAIGEARQLARTGNGALEDRLSPDMAQFGWLVQSASGAEELARTAAFPELSLPAWDLAEDSLVVEFAVLETPQGELYRVASFQRPPGMDRPGGPERGGGARPFQRRGGPPRRDFGPGRGPGRGPDGESDGEPRPKERFRVSVAAPLGEERAFLAILFRTLVLASLLAMGLSALLIPWAVRRGLRPVRQISEGIGRMDADRLDQSLDVGATPAELLPILQSFESARERLNDAFVRERRFSSDAAHELRTPLAGLRASMEVALRRERSTDHYRTTMSECLGITESMQGMVESLLLLAKGAAHELEREVVDLGAVWEEALAKRAEELAARRLSVRTVPEARLSISSNRVLLERIFANVVRNAAQYADEGSELECRFEAAQERISWTLSNAASELQSETAERAFEPLWRGDAARTDASLHAGLGLSIVQQCVLALEGTVAIEAADGRFAITVTLPR